MFKVITDPQFTHLVEVFAPVDGGHERQDFKARFRVVDTALADTLNSNMVESTKEFLRAAVVSLDDLADGSGKPLIYNDALRDQILELPYVRVGLLKAYFKAVGKAATGN